MMSRDRQESNAKEYSMPASRSVNSQRATSWPTFRDRIRTPCRASRIPPRRNRGPASSWQELSFSAFRVALIDPTARVRASRFRSPHHIPRVLGVAITGGFLNGETIHFSDNLNCLIGGRGAGKSTAIRATAYALGLNDDFDDFDSCPDSVTVFCEDANRRRVPLCSKRGGDIEVKAKDDRSAGRCTGRCVPR